MTSSKWKDVRISIDPLDKISNYIEFLKSYVSENYLWENESCLRRAVRRYEQNWLPLACEWKTSEIEPPRDVKWVWHLHMLNPKHYAEYCRTKYGKIIAHKIRTSLTEEKHCKERTALIWKDKYLHEPYELDTESLLKFDRAEVRNSSLVQVMYSSSHQANFLYQVLLPHYCDGVFQRFALDRYKQFLFLQKMEPQFCSDPPYDIQLLWRVHMLHPTDYVTDVTTLLRTVLDPHDTLSEVSGHMRVVVSNAEDIWFKHYAEPLFIAGSIYRGTDFRQISPFPKEHNIQEIIESCELAVDDVCISEVWCRQKNIFVQGRRMGGNSFTFTPFFTAKGKVGSAITSKDHKGLGSIQFDAKSNRGIELYVYTETGFGCTKAQHSLATVFYNPRDKFEDGSFFTRTLNVEIPKVSASDAHVKFTCNIKAVDRKPHALTLTRDPFVRAPMPKELLECVMSEPSWGQALVMGADTEYMVARHGMKSKLGPMGFGISVVKHEDTDSSAVLVYLNNNQLVCVAHSLAPEQFPTSDRVSATCPLHLEPFMDHAMLIRNSKGGWAAMKASWVSETTPGFGKVQIVIYNLESKELSKFTVRDDEMQTIKLDHVTIDMPTGRITLGAGCEHTAENIALAFCVGILFLTCQRKAVMTSALSGSMRSLSQIKFTDDAASDLTSQTSGHGSIGKQQGPVSRFSAKVKLQQRKRTRRRKMSASFTFLLACGLQVESYYHSLSQPPSRNGTLTLNDVPVIVNREGDVKFAGNATENGRMPNGGSMRVNHNIVPPPAVVADTAVPSEDYMDVRL